MVFCQKVKRELREEKVKTTDLTAKVELHRKATNDMAEEVLESQSKFMIEHLKNLRLQDEVDRLAIILASRFKMPDFTEILKNVSPVRVDPPNVKPYGGVHLGFQYDVSTVDLYYYAVPLETYEAMNQQVISLVKKSVTFRNEVFDCDNFARMFRAFISIGVRKAGYDHEVAFAYAQSAGHAYNLGMLPDTTLQVFEPQNGKTLGDMTSDIPGLSGKESYKTLVMRF